MIFHEPLTPAQMRRSQNNFIYYSLVNGVSYMCLGETVIVLLAVRMDMPDWCVSIIGALLYFGYLMMPLGKWMTSRVGAAKSQANFWVLRNFSALLVATGVIFNHFGMNYVAMGCLLTGAFFFYAFRAAGVVMSVPLMGNISDNASRARLFSLANSSFFISNAVAIVCITGLMNYTDSVWMLFAIVVFGACCGITASGFLRRIDETDALMKHAAKPLLKEVPEILRDRTIRRMFRANLGITPARYRRQCRHHAACELLAMTELSIKEIADRLGYSSQFHFSREFRRETGLPPRNWRRERRKTDL